MREDLPGRDLPTKRRSRGPGQHRRVQRLPKLRFGEDFDFAFLGRAAGRKRKGGRGGVPALTTPRGRISPRGWTDMGLPHYMGAGRYAWSESFAAEELDAGQVARLGRLDGLPMEGFAGAEEAKFRPGLERLLERLWQLDFVRLRFQLAQ